MAQQRRQQQQRGHRRGGLVVVLLLALLSLCLARADARASLALAGAAPASPEHGAATALENALAQEVARVHYTPSTAAPEEQDDGAAVPERMAMEATTQDYGTPCANGRHDPPKHP